jgi:hypothetical protein
MQEISAGVSAETHRRAAYEQLYAQYRAARRAHEEARARGARMAQLAGQRERVRALWLRLAAWRTATSTPE